MPRDGVVISVGQGCATEIEASHGDRGLAGQRVPKGHVLTVNLEDFFQVGALRHTIRRSYWNRFETRAEANTLRVLDLLDKYGRTATFFTLGWLADHLPDLIKEIARRGHEVASKGYYHRSLKEMTPEEFREDVIRARLAIERASGAEVLGYRIARGWFSRKQTWALDILSEEGHLYDASMRAIGLDGCFDTERRKPHFHQTPSGGIWELPPTTWQMLGLGLPVGGGNFIRQLPHSFMSRRIAGISAATGSLVFYFHVWELDAEFPRINGMSWLNRIRQYRNLDKMPARIEHYLKKYDFTAACAFLDAEPAYVAHEARDSVASHAGMTAAPIPKQSGRPVTVVVPCFNEEPVLGYLVKTLDDLRGKYAGSFDFRFVLVDDASTDNTWAGLRKLFGNYPNTKIVQHQENKGVAAASLTGIRAAETEIVCVMDCDCTYDPEQLTKMIPMLTDDIDLVTASPYHPEGNVLNVPGWRLFLSKSLSTLYGFVLRHKFHTYTACFRVYRRSAVEGLSIDNGGYLGIAEILARLDRSGSKIVECPAELEARLMGQSKMKVIRVILGHLKLLGGLLINKSHFVGETPTTVGSSQAVSDGATSMRTTL